MNKRYGVDPLVHLGIWTAAGFLEGRLDEDKRDFPIVAGVSIIGHDGDFYSDADSAVDEVISFIRLFFFPHKLYLFIPNR